MTNHGNRKMRFVDIDFDDAGRAPFVLDFIRYVAAIKAQCDAMKSEVLQENYVLGLRGKSVPPPKEVQEFLDMKVSDYDKKAAKYCEEHCEGAGFKLKEDEIEQYKGPITLDAIKKLFPGERVLSIAKRIEERAEVPRTSVSGHWWKGLMRSGESWS